MNTERWCSSEMCRRDLSKGVLSPVSIQTQSLSLRALRLDGNRAKRERLRWQAANHGCHCFDRASYWLLLVQLHDSFIHDDCPGTVVGGLSRLAHSSTTSITIHLQI